MMGNRWLSSHQISERKKIQRKKKKRTEEEKRSKEIKKKRNKEMKSEKDFENDSTFVTGEVSGSDKGDAENPYLNLGSPRVTVWILTIDGSTAPSSTYTSFDLDVPLPPRLI